MGNLRLSTPQMQQRPTYPGELDKEGLADDKYEHTDVGNR